MTYRKIIPLVVSLLDDLMGRKRHCQRSVTNLVLSAGELSEMPEKEWPGSRQYADVASWLKTVDRDSASFREAAGDFIMQHGDQLTAILAQYPRLLASHADYIEAQESGRLARGDMPNLEWATEIQDTAYNAWASKG